MAPFEPLGLTELAQRWGVSRQRLTQVLEQHPDLAALSVVLTRGRVWNKEDVEAWETARREAGHDVPGDRPRGRRRQS